MRLVTVARAEERDPPLDVGLALRLLTLDYIVLALQGSVVGHLQTVSFRCALAPLAAAFIGLRVGPAVGAWNGFLLGWATGALFSEPTSIPAVCAALIGALAGMARRSFWVESRPIRVTLALMLFAGGVALQSGLTLIVWQRAPQILPLSGVVALLLAPPADALVSRFLPESSP